MSAQHLHKAPSAGMWQGEQLTDVIMLTPRENTRLQHLAATGFAKRLALVINRQWPLSLGGV
jgi:hypothetical protein